MSLVTQKIIVLKVDKCYSVSTNVKCKTLSTLTIKLNPSKCSLSPGYV